MMTKMKKVKLILTSTEVHWHELELKLPADVLKDSDRLDEAIEEVWSSEKLTCCEGEVLWVKLDTNMEVVDGPDISEMEVTDA